MIRSIRVSLAASNNAANMTSVRRITSVGGTSPTEDDYQIAMCVLRLISLRSNYFDYHFPISF